MSSDEVEIFGTKVPTNGAPNRPTNANSVESARRAAGEALRAAGGARRGGGEASMFAAQRAAGIPPHVLPEHIRAMREQAGAPPAPRATTAAGGPLMAGQLDTSAPAVSLPQGCVAQVEIEDYALTIYVMALMFDGGRRVALWPAVLPAGDLDLAKAKIASPVFPAVPAGARPNLQAGEPELLTAPWALRVSVPFPRLLGNLEVVVNTAGFVGAGWVS